MAGLVVSAGMLLSTVFLALCWQGFLTGSVVFASDGVAKAFVLVVCVACMMRCGNLGVWGEDRMLNSNWEDSDVSQPMRHISLENLKWGDSSFTCSWFRCGVFHIILCSNSHASSTSFTLVFALTSLVELLLHLSRSHFTCWALTSVHISVWPSNAVASTLRCMQLIPYIQGCMNVKYAVRSASHWVAVLATEGCNTQPSQYQKNWNNIHKSIMNISAVEACVFSSAGRVVMVFHSLTMHCRWDFS